MRQVARSAVRHSSQRRSASAREPLVATPNDRLRHAVIKWKPYNAQPGDGPDDADEAVAMGTDGGSGAYENWASPLRKYASKGDSVRQGREPETAAEAHRRPRKTRAQPRISGSLSGEGGIRTRGSAKHYTGFRNRLLQPLGHLSKGPTTTGVYSLPFGLYRTYATARM